MQPQSQTTPIKPSMLARMTNQIDDVDELPVLNLFAIIDKELKHESVVIGGGHTDGFDAASTACSRGKPQRRTCMDSYHDNLVPQPAFNVEEEYAKIQAEKAVASATACCSHSPIQRRTCMDSYHDNLVPQPAFNVEEVSARILANDIF